MTEFTAAKLAQREDSESIYDEVVSELGPVLAKTPDLQLS